MSAPLQPPPLPDFARPDPGKVLRKLFLTLFLRGRSSRGLQRESAPKTVSSKLLRILLIYAFVGVVTSTVMIRAPLFLASLYFHCMTLAFLGMFVAASAGEVLFNKEEADILMHRPVGPRTMLWAKITVLVQVSLWLAGAFNLGPMIFGTFKGGWLFPLAHALSTCGLALFSTAGIVVTYQLCLRWFGRERMEGLMTTAQVLVAVGAVLLGQAGPHLMARMQFNSGAVDAWWINLLPPAWFAGFDDAVAGSHAPASWVLAGVGFGTMALALWLAFGKLARDYEVGLQSMNEARTDAPSRGGRRFLDKLVHLPPLSWWLRDSVTRASFLLTAAYLVRDRDVKLRLYPGIAPLMIMPFVLFFRSPGMSAGPADGAFSMAGFGVAFAGAYLGLIPFLALYLIRHSQQWQASDLFRVAPMPGPGPLCFGASRAILFCLTLPALLVFGVIMFFITHQNATLLLFIPGVLTLPIYALIPCLGGKAVPLSLPTEEAKSAGRGLSMIGFMAISGVIALLTVYSRNLGIFWWFVLGETLLVTVVCLLLHQAIGRSRWLSAE